jgi:hypothetical protein
MGLFGKIKEAKPSMDANYDRDGSYISKIIQVKVGESRKKETFVAIEKMVIKVYDDGEGKGHKAGELATHMMMTKHDSFEGNFKSFVMNTTGCAKSEIDENACEKIVSERQPMAGMIIRHINKTIQTRAGHDFTVVSYKGEVLASEVPELLGNGEDLIERFFPDGQLEELIALEEE